MPIINGEKWACESCVRGHRVSTCQHKAEERPLKLIPPKGRPVKQCEHCRTARKSKSHHGKCACGSKKDKKESDSIEVTGDLDCCCHIGEICACAIRHEPVGIRMERSLKRTTHPVKSKPALSKSLSEDKLLHVMNGHHKPCHRNNNLAHTSGAPYKVPAPRPRSIHGTSPTKSDDDKILEVFSAADDTLLRHNSMFLPSTSRTISDDGSDQNRSIPEEISSYDIDSHFARPAVRYTNSMPIFETVSEESAINHNYSTSYSQEYAIGMNNIMGLTINTSSPNFIKDSSFQLFSPSDLPLISPHMPNFSNQTISHSSDSANDSLWADQHFAAGQVAVEDAWTSQDLSNVGAYFPDDSTKHLNTIGSSSSAMSAAMDTAQLRHLSGSSAATAIHHASSDNAGPLPFGFIIPKDPDSPDDEPEEDWAFTNFENFTRRSSQPVGLHNAYLDSYAQQNL